MTRDPREIASAIQGRAMDVTGTGEVVYDEELCEAADALLAQADEIDRMDGSGDD